MIFTLSPWQPCNFHCAKRGWLGGVRRCLTTQCEVADVSTSSLASDGLKPGGLERAYDVSAATKQEHE